MTAATAVRPRPVRPAAGRAPVPDWHAGRGQCTICTHGLTRQRARHGRARQRAVRARGRGRAPVGQHQAVQVADERVGLPGVRGRAQLRLQRLQLLRPALTLSLPRPRQAAKEHHAAASSEAWPRMRRPRLQPSTACPLTVGARKAPACDARHCRPRAAVRAGRPGQLVARKQRAANCACGWMKEQSDMLAAGSHRAPAAAAGALQVGPARERRRGAAQAGAGGGMAAGRARARRWRRRPCRAAPPPPRAPPRAAARRPGSARSRAGTARAARPRPAARAPRAGTPARGPAALGRPPGAALPAHALALRGRAETAGEQSGAAGRRRRGRAARAAAGRRGARLHVEVGLGEQVGIVLVLRGARRLRAAAPLRLVRRRRQACRPAHAAHRARWLCTRCRPIPGSDPPGKPGVPLTGSTSQCVPCRNMQCSGGRPPPSCCAAHCAELYRPRVRRSRMASRSSAAFCGRTPSGGEAHRELHTPSRGIAVRKSRRCVTCAGTLPVLAACRS